MADFLDRQERQGLADDLRKEGVRGTLAKLGRGWLSRTFSPEEGGPDGASDEPTPEIGEGSDEGGDAG